MKHLSKLLIFTALAIAGCPLPALTATLAHTELQNNGFCNVSYGAGCLPGPTGPRAPSFSYKDLSGNGYRLRPLPELERYLKANKHLPTVPSAQEVQANGVDLGAMQARLLQQVEELTLHVIELAKQNERLQAEVARLAAGK